MLLTALRCPGRPSPSSQGTPQISRQNGPEWKHSTPSRLQLQIRPSTGGQSGHELLRAAGLPEAPRRFLWLHLAGKSCEVSKGVDASQRITWPSRSSGLWSPQGNILGTQSPGKGEVQRPMFLT